jgi:N-carbamoylputrescine amidase
MRVTVCEMSDDRDRFQRDWEGLARHVKTEKSDLVLLPEMPFHPWPARSRPFRADLWDKAVSAHEAWMPRLTELAPAVVAGTRPMSVNGQRLNQGFVWGTDTGHRAAHIKCYLPEEEGFWEASWFGRGEPEFAPLTVRSVLVGFLICTEIWFGEHARAYGLAGTHIIVCPRATPLPSVDKWIAGGRAAAVVSGAFCLSSCRGGRDSQGMDWSGRAWIIHPEEGDVVGTTTREHRFLTMDIDLADADRAKGTYPRYVKG